MKFAGQIFLRRFCLSAVVLLVMGGGAFFAFSQFDARRAAKRDAYEQYKRNLIFIDDNIFVLRKKLPRMDYLRWQATEDAATLFSATLERILRDAPPGSLVRESISVTPVTGLLGFKPNYAVHDVEVALSGNYVGLQSALLSLETMLPNLFLLDMSLEGRAAQLSSGVETPHLFAKLKYALIGVTSTSDNSK